MRSFPRRDPLRSRGGVSVEDAGRRHPRAGGTADDSAIFVDVKTAWIIEGLGHGHEDAEKLGPEAKLADPSGSTEGAVRLNASVVQYNEVTGENAENFHFHGEIGDYPVTGAIVLPADEKGQALLKGRYGKAGGLQLVSPASEMDELFATVFSVQDLVLRLLFAIGIATLAIGALVFLLSNRLRREEFRHLRHSAPRPRPCGPSSDSRRSSSSRRAGRERRGTDRARMAHAPAPAAVDRVRGISR